MESSRPYIQTGLTDPGGRLRSGLGRLRDMQQTCWSSRRSLTRPHSGPDSLLFPFYSSRGYCARGFKIAQARDPLRNRASTTLVCPWSFSETLVALRPPCNPLILESRVILANPLPFCPSIPRGPVREIRHGPTSAVLILFSPPRVQFRAQFRACA